MRRALKTSRVRLGIARILFIAMFLVVGGRAFYLQVIEGDKLMRLGQRQHLKEWTVLPKRGAVLDRGGEPLALSMEGQSVYARPHRIQDIAKAGRDLSRILKISQAELKQKLSSAKPFVWIKRQISPGEAGRIQELNIEGIGMFYEPRRYYPQGQLAGQVIGFVGRDSEGLEGLELRYNDYIRGEPGSSVAPGACGRSGGTADSARRRYSFDPGHIDSASCRKGIGILYYQVPGKGRRRHCGGSAHRRDSSVGQLPGV
jgi:cell division protein FtsI (penicillin-binding protein 3)